MSDPQFKSLLESFESTNVDKFSALFEVKQSTYTSGNGIDQIGLHILVPRSLSDAQRQQPRPLVIKIHGGYLVVQVDLEQTLLLGESAGGYLAMQLALSYPSDIHGLIALYPMLDPQSEFYTACYQKPFHGVQNRPMSVIDDHLNTLQSTPRDQRKPVTEVDVLSRLELSFAIVQNGRIHEFLGNDDQRLFPIQRLLDEGDADALHQGAKLPPMFLFHGREDSVVPHQGTIPFAETLGKSRPLARYHLQIQPGDHGFDADASVDTTGWLKRGLDFVTAEWLKAEKITTP
ncbi:hypothetical protein FE257_013035 [Aspergillus nanangensis]|uniref:AB hydrolase-1 domain-containing protein n=1 Tax=Aspergillus nanangensis TaxID=2582783 RepID=A0AAD4CGE4_ASPNN|nr:hypothetical protein FE257_013035 [Aspergillus nanangensis]